MPAEPAPDGRDSGTPLNLEGVLDELDKACARALQVDRANAPSPQGNLSSSPPAAPTALPQPSKTKREAKRAGPRVSVADIMATLGPRSFGPLLLVPGLIGLSPIGAIPFLPGIMAVIVFYVSAQILIGMDHIWLPDGLTRRSIEAKHLARALAAIRPYARFVDRLLWPRISFLTRGIFLRLIAVLCLAVAIVTPPIEIIPLAGIVPNAAIVAFGLAVTAHDGLWALIAILVSAASFWLIYAVV